MECSDLLNLFGLVLNLVGLFVLTFNSYSDSKKKFDRPPKSDNPAHENLYNYINKVITYRNNQVKKRVRQGLCAMIIGFGLQVIAIFA